LTARPTVQIMTGFLRASFQPTLRLVATLAVAGAMTLAGCVKAAPIAPPSPQRSVRTALPAEGELGPASWIGAADATHLYLATAVVPNDDLDQAVAELVAQVLAANRDAVVEIKALLAAAGTRDFAAQEAAERAAQVRRLRDLVGLGE